VARAWSRAIGVTVIVVALDQLTKAWVTSAIDRGDRDNVFLGLDLVNVRNKGVAFGFFGGGGAIVAVVTASALALLVVWFALHTNRPLIWLPTGLLLGGAIGNLIDRARLGAVRDFIDPPAWPAFNVADIAITFGVLSLLYVLETTRNDERPAD
jgi:signal peptidase II